MNTNKVNEITHAVIGAAIEVHRQLGPGLLESAYIECLCRELILRGIAFERHPEDGENVRAAAAARHRSVAVLDDGHAGIGFRN